MLIDVDKDLEALAVCKNRFQGQNVKFVHSDFKSLPNILRELNITKVDGILADLGVSSYQFDTPERGFSYMHDAKLDMRMQIDAPLSAYNVVNEYSEFDLRKIINDYGEERFAGRIAANICKARAERKIETTFQLSEIIKSAIPTPRVVIARPVTF